MSLRTIKASEEGAKRRKAEYMVLRLLAHREQIHCDEIDDYLHNIHQYLIENEIESPLHFRLGGSNGPESKQVDESLERLLQYGRIRLTTENNYQLTEAGKHYLGDADALERDRIDDTFRSAIRESVVR